MFCKLAIFKKALMDKKSVNLGSGTDYIKGWINVDIEPFYHPDVIADLQKPFPFKSNSIDEIKASDIIEHFTKEDGEIFIRECHRILKVGGIVTFRSHDVYEIFKKFANDPDVLIHFLYGNTEVTGVFGAHKFAYTKEFAEFILTKIGFSIVSYTTEDTNFVLVGKKEKTKPPLPLKIGILLQPSRASLVEEIKKQPDISVVDVKEKNQSYDVVLASGGLQKILASIMCWISDTPVVWLEDQEEVEVIGNTFISKLLYRLVRHIPQRVIVQDKNSSISFMMHTRVSLSKIVFLTPGENINTAKETAQQKVAHEVSKVVDSLKDAVILSSIT